MPLQNEDIHKQREAYQILQLVAARLELQGHFPILSNSLSFLKDLIMVIKFNTIYENV